MQANDLYIGGSSGTGQYAPLIALKIAENKAENQINLKVKITTFISFDENILAKTQ